MLPFSPRLRLALSTAEEIAKGEGRGEVMCFDIIRGITSLNGGVADNLLKARGFSSPIPAVTMESLNHETKAYSVDSLQALSTAMHEAASRSRELIGIEDMLIGVLTPPCAEISRAFAEKNVNVQELVLEVRKQI